MLKAHVVTMTKYCPPPKKTRFSKAVPHHFQQYLFQLESDGFSHVTIRNRERYVRKLYLFLAEQMGISESEMEDNFPLITLSHVREYEKHINELVQKGKLALRSRSFPLLATEEFIDYLFKKQVLSFQFRRLQNSKRRSSNPIPPIVDEFIEYLTQKNYSSLAQHRTSVMRFVSFVNQSHPNGVLTKINRNHISEYEQFLKNRIVNEQLTPASAYQYLLSLKLFLGFLSDKQIIMFTYVIPQHLVAQGKRANEYVPKEDIIRLLQSIQKIPRHYGRNMAIFLLILDTGCRPIEIANLKLSDVNISEMTVSLFSKKSGQRKLKVDPVVMKALKLYILQREKECVDHDSFFLKDTGEPLTVKIVNQVFAKANKNAFGKALYSAKALRHTYATNALDNHNNFDQTSKTMGHKYWVSTMYYLHRSHKRLLNNTLAYDPTTFINRGDL
ncbi:site-specific integrase [Brevibacillus sp. DP1.3A]|uniref:tyrosine-type recombinase/integrase n=1 Tax=Brevibacillus sp. DP1.3A TaxID=2738867 RepID=UPI00156BAE29|nr:site-specific integrase [Brevibacillus sp. DP1.3A]UED72185.1 site-specific integrase [Brevibacillus sp. DP1.3A]